MSNRGLLSPFLKNTNYTDRYGDIRAIPLVTKTAAFTIERKDNGVGFSVSAGITIPLNLQVGFSCTLYNDTATAVTITITSGVTARASASATTKTSFSLVPYGMASVWCNKLNNFVLAGDIA
jgi:hypothetical protein